VRDNWPVEHDYFFLFMTNVRVNKNNNITSLDEVKFYLMMCTREKERKKEGTITNKTLNDKHLFFLPIFKYLDGEIVIIFTIIIIF